MHMGYLWGHFGVIQCTCLKMACNSKMVNGRATRSEIWDSWLLVTCIWHTFELLVLNIILGSFDALVSKWCVAGRQLPVERNGVKFGNWGYL